MLLYLDLNCFNRPFDDQTQERTARETGAVFSILQRVVGGVDQMAWSAILDFENSQHPMPDRRSEIARWKHRAVVNIAVNEDVSLRAQELEESGFRPLDAAHLASAEVGECDCFLTCDDRLTRAAQRSHLALKVLNPVDYLEETSDARTDS